MLHRVLLDRFDALPPRLQAIAPRMAAQDWLGGMRSRASVDGTVRSIARRLSRGGDLLLACLDDLRTHADDIEAAFGAFFPALIAATASSNGASGTGR